jgi:predicted RNase H-like HicB family nuclease
MMMTDIPLLYQYSKDVSQGSTWDEALEIIGEAITGYIENLTLLKKPVPIEVAVQLKDPFSV